ncbi:MAG: acylneuraminate cytidylyltransferase family protein [Gammaproteobacteria bacterium]|nr:MAG: acylneuraminate cytidylyltransferase family protein [Gammaproteobacteria bacterium]
MIAGKSFLAVVPARGGSKGVPRKNVREVAGRPLLAYTLEAAQAVNGLDRIVVSSEDAEILELAAALGAEPLPRPVGLAQDTTPGVAVLLDALERCPGYDYVVLLQPTSPLRAAADIEGAIARCLEMGAPLCVTVTAADKSPWWMFTEGSDGRLRPLLPGPVPSRRQEAPEVLLLNGAVYVAEVAWLQRTGDLDYTSAVPYRMPAERSLDIDTKEDLRLLELRLARSGTDRTGGT